jgi:ABC-2 type transport system ATP-binding protein
MTPHQHPAGPPPTVPGAADAPTVVVEDLTKVYGDVHALDGISFESHPGEVFGLLGHNGAGKSTTIRILTGRARPTSGRVEVLGHELPRDFARIRSQINLVAESPTVYGRASARENLELFCKLYGLPKHQAGVVLERVRLSGVAKRKVKDFSTGMKQRLLLARALLNTPRTLFLDEPTRGLDPQSARELHELVGELSREGTTVFLTTHDMLEADQLCHRVAFLSEGRIAALDTPRALKLSAGESPEVDVVLDDGEEVRLALGDEQDARRMGELAASGRVRTVHSREATLADVFIRVAGRSLEDIDGTADDRESKR